MKNKIITRGRVISGTSILLMFVLYHFIFNFSTTKKIGVVQMNELVYEYQGMKDATELFSGKMTDWSNQNDSIKKILENYLYDIKMDSINKDFSKLKIDQQKFMLLKEKYIEYNQKIQENSKSEDEKMTISVINQIKDYMSKYAEENNYDLIITNTQVESVGYVKEKLDITKDLLKYVNEKYEGKN